MVGRRSDRGVLLFAYFLLDKQEKVRRPRFGNRKLIYYSTSSRGARTTIRRANNQRTQTTKKQGRRPRYRAIVTFSAMHDIARPTAATAMADARAAKPRRRICSLRRTSDRCESCGEFC